MPWLPGAESLSRSTAIVSSSTSPLLTIPERDHSLYTLFPSWAKRNMLYNFASLFYTILTPFRPKGDGLLLIIRFHRRAWQACHRRTSLQTAAACARSLTTSSPEPAPLHRHAS